MRNYAMWEMLQRPRPGYSLLLGAVTLLALGALGPTSTAAAACTSKAPLLVRLTWEQVGQQSEVKVKSGGYFTVDAANGDVHTGCLTTHALGELQTKLRAALFSERPAETSCQRSTFKVTLSTQAKELRWVTPCSPVLHDIGTARLALWLFSLHSATKQSSLPHRKNFDPSWPAEPSPESVRHVLQRAEESLRRCSKHGSLDGSVTLIWAGETGRLQSISADGELPRPLVRCLEAAVRRAGRLPSFTEDDFSYRTGTQFEPRRGNEPRRKGRYPKGPTEYNPYGPRPQLEPRRGDEPRRKGQHPKGSSDEAWHTFE